MSSRFDRGEGVFRWRGPDKNFAAVGDRSRFHAGSGQQGRWWAHKVLPRSWQAFSILMLESTWTVSLLIDALSCIARLHPFGGKGPCQVELSFSRSEVPDAEQGAKVRWEVLDESVCRIILHRVSNEDAVMDQATAKKELAEIIRMIQEKSGNHCPELTGETKPLDDVEKFCTKRAVLAISKIAKKLHLDIPVKENLFFDKETESALTIDQIAAKICKYPAAASGQDAA